MLVDVRDIPAEGLALRLEEEAERLGLSVPGSVTVNLLALRSGTSVYLTGELTAHLRLSCGRCLAEFSQALNLPVSVTLEQGGHEPRLSGIELKEEDLDVSFYRGHTIELDDVAREEILLNLPMRPLCKENCLGLCPQCGQDLNSSGCVCSPEARNCSKPSSDNRAKR